MSEQNGIMTRIDWEKRERGYHMKALELVKGAPAWFNIAPVLDLVKKADLLGFEVVRKSDSEEGAAK